MMSNVCMAKSEEDLGNAAKEAALSCAFNSLPVTEVRLILFCFVFIILILSLS